ncbi:MAG: winged helix-turn-helix domain-containing protein [Paracoccaceae bacterium]
MKEGPDIARIAALIGDPARANILVALMSGHALTVSELAAEAGIGLSTTSAHLAQLQNGGLVSPRKSGRHKYFSLGSEEAAALLEAMMGFAATTGQLRHQPGPKDAGLRAARVCYNHLAGDRGVTLFAAMIRAGHLIAMPEGLALTAAGHDFAVGFGIAGADLIPGRGPLCRECLDWSARRSHLGGRLGRAILQQIEAKGWAKRQNGSRAIVFSAVGATAFQATFGLGELAPDQGKVRRLPLDAAADCP